MLVIGATGALAWLITVEQVAVQMAAWIRLVASEPWQFLMLVNVILLLLGIFIEPLPALLLTAPLLLPLAKTFNVDLVHLGVVMTANLAIALYTPPVGGTLFVAAKLAKAGIGEVTRALWPLLRRRDRGAVRHHLRAVADHRRVAARELTRSNAPRLHRRRPDRRDRSRRQPRARGPVRHPGQRRAGRRDRHPGRGRDGRRAQVADDSGGRRGRAVAGGARVARGARRHPVLLQVLLDVRLDGRGQHRPGDRGAAAGAARGHRAGHARVSAQPAHRLPRPSVRRRPAAVRHRDAHASADADDRREPRAAARRAGAGRGGPRGGRNARRRRRRGPRAPRGARGGRPAARDRRCDPRRAPDHRRTSRSPTCR